MRQRVLSGSDFDESMRYMMHRFLHHDKVSGTFQRMPILTGFSAFEMIFGGRCHGEESIQISTELNSLPTNFMPISLYAY